MGYVKQHTGSYNLGLLAIAAVMASAGLVGMAFPARVTPPAGAGLQPALD